MRLILTQVPVVLWILQVAMFDGPGGDNGSFTSFATKDHAPRAVDNLGGDIGDPGGGTTNDWGSFSNLTTSASTSSKA